MSRNQAAQPSGRLVREVMGPPGPVLAPATTLAEATQAMSDCDRAVLPVCGPTVLLGTISADDIRRRVAGRESDPARITVREAMRADVQYCFDDQDEGRVTQVMQERRIAYLVVIDRERVPVGIMHVAETSLAAEEEVPT